jgi:adenylyltransferase/sulfurtransferase
VKEIDHHMLQTWMSENRPFALIDVREPEEHHAFNIGGTLLPLDDILKSADKIPNDLPVVFYCKRGIRSQIAIQRLSRIRDTDNFLNLKGGILPMRSK